MKKVLLVVFIAGLFNFNAEAGDKDKMIDGGLYLNAGLFLPSAKYGTINFSGFDKDTDGTNFGLGGSFQFGHIFAITQFSDFGVGIRSTWIEIDVAFDNSNFLTRYLIQTSLVKAGPQFSYLISDDIAVDAYYQISPTISVVGDENDAFTGLGATHSLGITFRWKVLSVGLENSFGSISFDDLSSFGTSASLRTNSIKLNIGVQF